MLDEVMAGVSMYTSTPRNHDLHNSIQNNRKDHQQSPYAEPTSALNFYAQSGNGYSDPKNDNQYLPHSRQSNAGPPPPMCLDPRSQQRGLPSAQDQRYAGQRRRPPDPPLHDESNQPASLGFDRSAFSLELPIQKPPLQDLRHQSSSSYDRQPSQLYNDRQDLRNDKQSYSDLRYNRQSSTDLRHDPSSNDVRYNRQSSSDLRYGRQQANDNRYEQHRQHPGI